MSKLAGKVVLFPLAFLLNTTSVTVLLIAAGLLGKAELAADIAIVQGANLAVFLAFSANARNIILSQSAHIPWRLILMSRVLLVVPLGCAALLVSMYLTDVGFGLAVILVLRRCSEWISEVHLARMEREGEYAAARKYVASQLLLLGVAIVAVGADFDVFSLGLVFWALLPLILGGRFLVGSFHLGSLVDRGWVYMLPHFGSTAITGITVFVFRLVILLLVGKEFAGNLFTAFAIGGILGSVFAQALGPTLVYHAEEGVTSDMPGWLILCMLGSVGVGTALVVGSTMDWQILVDTGKSLMFWKAIGASFIGGAIMVLAQRFRLRVLQQHEHSDTFGPDVLTNIFIVSCVPYVYYLLGQEFLSWLFLINAVIALIFYASASWTICTPRKILAFDSIAFKQTVAVGLLIPIFFQLKGAVFREETAIRDSGGDLLNLPIPISVLVCYGAIVALGTYGRARESLTVIFLCFCLMVLSTVLSTDSQSVVQQAKVILLIQFILPMLALVLGQTFESNSATDKAIAKSYLYVVALVTLLQLMATGLQELPLLSSYLYVFSIYQHIQYVSVIFVCVFVMAVFTLWSDRTHRTVMIALAVPMGAYAMLSLSMLTVGGLVLGSVAFVAYSYLHKSARKWKSATILTMLIIIGVFSMTPVTERILRSQGKIGDTLETQNIKVRFEIWQYYLDEITGDNNEWMLGHQSPPDRSLYPSAHNYYLDFVYNFGLFALMPIISLIVFTLWKSGRHWKEILADPSYFALAGGVLFLVIVDNSLKVGMRQPYPAIVTFFLWGLLLSRLNLLGGKANTPGGRL